MTAITEPPMSDRAILAWLIHTGRGLDDVPPARVGDGQADRLFEGGYLEGSGTVSDLGAVAVFGAARNLSVLRAAFPMAMDRTGRVDALANCAAVMDRPEDRRRRFAENGVGRPDIATQTTDVRLGALLLPDLCDNAIWRFGDRALSDTLGVATESMGIGFVLNARRFLNTCVFLRGANEESYQLDDLERRILIGELRAHLRGLALDFPANRE